jgi:hypothetical protein
MSVPRSAAEMLGEHVTLEVDGIDRMYLNVYVPQVRREEGVASFFRFHRGHQFASGALMDPISKTFVAALEAFARQERVPGFSFGKVNAKTTSPPNTDEIHQAGGRGVHHWRRKASGSRLWTMEC